MSLQALLARHPLRRVVTAAGTVAYREAGSGPTLALLHGIGSSSDSWIRQLDGLAGRFRVLAWNAPGYQGSDALPAESPTAREYGERVLAWLDALGADGFVLAGQSLGALMATAATLLAPQRVRRLILLAPAGGYGDADPAIRQGRLAERLDALARLGPAGLAEKRGAAMVSPTASAEERDLVRAAMAQIVPHGYAQAARMLNQGRLAADLAGVTCPIRVASGSADAITPPPACDLIARAARTERLDLGPVGHTCQLEASARVNRLLADEP